MEETSDLSIFLTTLTLAAALWATLTVALSWIAVSLCKGETWGREFSKPTREDFLS
jgi:hypothetical protein